MSKYLPSKLLAEKLLAGSLVCVVALVASLLTLVGPAADTAQAQPGNRIPSYFNPSINITVSQVDADGNNINDFAGQAITLTFRRAPGQHINCSGSRFNMVVADNGSVVFAPGSSTRLINLWNRQIPGSTCAFSISYARSNSGPGSTSLGRLEFVAGATSTVSASSPNIRAQLTSRAVIQPSVFISVPQTLNSDGTNTHAGKRFTVGIDRIAGSSTGCSHNVRATFEVNDTGAVVLAQGSVLPSTLEIRQAGQTTNCVYSVSFPTSVQGIHRQGGATDRLNIGNTIATAIYSATAPNQIPTSTFTPTITINVPDSFKERRVGASFTVAYVRVANANRRCTAHTTATVTINSSGNPVTTNSATLIDRPGGLTTRCQYRVVFPYDVQVASSPLSLSSSSGTTVSGGSRASSATYVEQLAQCTPPFGSTRCSILRFEPAVFLTVTQQDADHNGINDFAGQVISVDIDRLSHVTQRCLGDTIDMVVANDGSVGLAPGESINRLVGVAGGVAELADRARTPICEYAVRYTVRNSGPGSTSLGRLAIVGGHTFRLSAHSPLIRAEFSSPTAFQPSVFVTIPQTRDSTGANTYSGQRITVNFSRSAGSSSGCTSNFSTTYEVNDAGAVVLAQGSSLPLILIDRPAGQSEDSSSARCQYQATFPSQVGGLRLLGNRARRLYATSPTVTASYATAATDTSTTTFIPTANITIPTAQRNRLRGTTFAVTYTRVANASTVCTRVATSVVTVNTSGTPTTTTQVNLVNRPEGMATRCEYTVTYPLYIDGSPDLKLDSTTHTTINGGDGVSTATYVVPSSNDNFTAMPVFSFLTPWVDTNQDDRHDFNGVRFVVSFTATGSNASSCARRVDDLFGVIGTQYNLRIFRDGSIGIVPSSVGDFNAPLRIRGGGGECNYNVNIRISGPTNLFGLALVAGSTSRLNGRNPVVLAEFTTRTTIPAAVNFTVPQTQDNPDGNNDHSGTRFTVEFSQTQGNFTGCTADFSTVFEVADDGSVGLAQGSSLPALTDRAAGQPEATRCIYTVTLPNQPGNLTLQGSTTRRLYASNPTLSASYTARTSNFTPTIAVTAPQINDDGDNANDLSGTNFRVTFTRVSGSHNGCTQSARATATIADDGTVPVTTTATLVNRPQGASARCQYDVAFQTPVGELTLQPGATAMVDGTSRTASATYHSPTSNFTPTITITAPQINDDGDNASDLSGIEFRVTFTPVEGADSGCSPTTTAIATVADDGSVPVTTTATLVDRPTGIDARCQYTVAISNAVEGLILQPGVTTMVNGGALAVTATYFAPTSSFAPTVTIAVPQTDDNTAGTNDYSGTEFRVTFTPVVGANGGCTQSATATVTIGDDGSSTVATAASLVNRPYGVDARCQYDVAFASTVGDLFLLPGATATVDITAPAAMAAYHDPTKPFAPAVAITVPQIDEDSNDVNDFSGTEFEVTFTPVSGADSSCTQTATATVEIGDDGSSTVSTPAMLADQPAGVTTRCQYDVAFPATVGMLVLQPGSTATIDVNSSTATAVYTTPLFTSEITITVPNADRDSNSVHDFSGTEIEVTFTPVMGADSGCTQTATATATIADDSTTSITAEVNLVDRPAGVNTACQYDVSFPAEVTLADRVGLLVLQSNATATVDTSSSTAAATYLLTEFFTPTITITVPQQSQFHGTRFRVIFARVAGQNSGCTQTATAAAAIGNDGNSRVTTPATLVDRPAGVSTRCQYNVIFPTPVGELELQSGSTATVTATAATATATYTARAATSFRPTITISVPAENRFNGARFNVTYVPASGARDDCTRSATATATVNVSGSNVSTTVNQATLIDRPAGVSARCEYRVVFPARVIHSSRHLNFSSISSGRTVSATSASSSVVYVDSTPPLSQVRIFSFSPTISLTVSQDDANGDGVHDFAGQVIHVQIIAERNSTSDCRGDTVDMVVAENGSVGLRQGETIRNLVATVTSNISCAYDVRYVVRNSGAGSTSLGRIGLVSGATSRLTPDSTAIVARFTAPTAFQPSVDISVPQTADADTGVNTHAGVTFTVGFTRAAGPSSGCTADFSTVFVVADNGSVGLAPGSSLPMLTERPAGQTTTCEYAVNFPTFSGGLQTQSGGVDRVNTNVRTASVVYDTAATSFRPTSAIVVPQINDDGNTANDFAGATFMVTFTRAEGASNLCTPVAMAVATVANDGTTSFTTPATLVGQPARTTTLCQYAVALPDVAGTLTLQPGSTTMVTSDSPAVSATYFAPASSFRPVVSVTVPLIDDNTHGTNDYSGTEFMVVFTPVEGADSGCTATAATTATIGDNGQSTATTPMLVNHPTGVDARCQYDVAFPAVAGLVLQPGATATVDAASQLAAATYFAPTSSFSPAITITVPQIDDDGDNANDFSGTAFTVAFARVAGANAGCTETATATVTIDDDGNSEVITAAMLVNRPSGINARCAYSVTYFAAAGSTLGLQSGATERVDAANPTVAADYLIPIGNFSPTITITVPQTQSTPGVNDYTGTEFDVTFTRVSGANTGCTQTATATATIGDNGQSTATAVVLVNRLTGEAARCRYDVTLPVLVGELMLQSGYTTVVDGANSTIAANYLMFAAFSPAITIAVPQTYDNTPGFNDYTGTAFDVTFTRVEGADAGCIQSATVTVTIDNNGAASAAAPAVLVDRPAGVTARCQYSVAFPPTVDNLTLQPGATATVSATSPAVSATYFVLTTFAPAVVIDVPQLDDRTAGTNDFTGTEFMVGFAPTVGSDAGCTQTATATATIGDDGNSEVTTAVVLVDRPRGVNVRCEYAVTFPPTVGNLSLQPGSVATVSATAVNASATYFVPDSTFSPAVTIRVPDRRRRAGGPFDSRTVNVFSGVNIRVNFTPVDGSDAGCTQSAGATVRINDGGGSNVTSAATLVNRPSGFVARCEYAVTFPPTASRGLVLQPGATSMVDHASRSASASYGEDGTFEPSIELVVPDGFSGTRFTITYRRVDGSHPGCTRVRTAVRETLGETSSFWQLGHARPSLVDRPAGQSSRCRYRVTVPSVVGNLRWIGGGQNTIIHADSPSSRSSYGVAPTTATSILRFSPTVSIAVTHVDADGNNNNDFAGQTFAVSFARTASSSNNCTATSSVTLSVANNGTVGLASGQSFPNLVARRGDETALCQYNVTFPASSGSLRLAGGATSTVNASSPTATARYTFTATTNFQPSVAISVPQTDNVRTGANDFSGARFTVAFSRSGGPAAGCSSDSSVVFEVGNDGSVSLVQGSSLPTLVDVPTGESTSCQYSVSFPSSAGTQLLPRILRLAPSSSTSVSATAAAATATYTVATTFVPVLDIMLPDRDDDSDNVNDFADTPLVVSFSRIGGPSSGCSLGGAQTVSFQDDGRAERIFFPTLMRQPEGRNTLCRYSVHLPSTTTTGLTLRPGSTSTVDIYHQVVSATYHARTSTFTATINLSVPQTQDNTPGTNDYAGTTFDITFTPVTNSDTGCTQSATTTITIADDGSSTVSTTRLVDRPTGVEARCQYSLGYPATAANGNLRRVLGSNTVSATRQTATAVYSASAVTTSSFTPAITIVVPQTDDMTAGTNDYTGTNFSITFTRTSTSHSRCTQSATATATITSDGGSMVTAPVTLLDRVEITAEQSICQYLVAFFAASTRILTQQPGATQRANSGAADVTVTYAAPTSTFTPTVAITVPEIEDAVAGTNDYSGTEFEVTFSRVTGANIGCTRTATATVTIGDDGTSSAVVPTLVNRPSGVDTRCQYDVAFPTATGLVLQAGATATVSATSLAASATYFLPTTNFTPAIAIAVPNIDDDNNDDNDFADTEFEVTFARVVGANAGCTQSVAATVTIADDGTSEVTTEAMLVDRPTGVVARCGYSVAFPATAMGLVLQAGSTTMVSATAADAAAAYAVVASNFTPTVTITVPQTEDNTPGTNDYSGTTFDVTFTRVAGANAGCTETATSTATIGDNGQSTATVVMLANRPAGVEARCEYAVSFPAAMGTLGLQSGATSVVNAGASTALAVYLNAALSFSNATPAGAEGSVAERIRVGVSPVNSCDPGTEMPSQASYVLDAGGLVNVGVLSQDCDWEITFVQVIGVCLAGAQAKSRVNANLGAAVTAGSLELTGAGGNGLLTYQGGEVESIVFTVTSTCATSFTPTVTITVPDIDDGTAGTNDFTGTEFEVTFTPVTNSDAGCTQTATATVSIDDNGDSSVTAAAALIDQPINIVARCQYDVEFPAATGLVLQAGSTATVSATAAAATATYFAPVSSFTPTVTITVPDIDDTTAGTNDYSGTEFDVTFTRVTGANAGCTETATSTATIGDDGESAAAAIMLVDRPTGVTDRCQYDVAFPASATGLVLQTGSTSTVSATAAAATATYFAPTTNFTPTITITVPDIDDITAGTNDYSGTEFDVTFTRVTGANAGCTETATSTATIGDDGESAAAAIMLVDRPTGVTDRCQYDVAFPASATGLTIQPGSTATVSAAAATATATYFAPTTNFTPTITITVPDIDDTTAGTNDYTGTEFDLTFTRVTGANAGCTETATSTATIGDNGGTTATDVTLVNRPTGITTRCQYNVAFPASATGLTIQPGSTTTVTATSLAASATYFAPTTNFTPTITITVPDIDDTTAGTNDYTGTTFDVTFTRITGANAGCTETATSTATIGDNGGTTATDVTLVNRPTGITTRCQYDVAFPASATGLVLQAGSTATVSAAAATATATYFAPTTNFTPTITVNVPQTDDTTVGTNDYTGTEFDVTFTRVTGANAGCTESATSTATIGDNGQSTTATIALVDRPTGITDRCQYDVMFPAATGLTIQPGSTTTVSATAAAASATYWAPTSTFAPTITITVPQTDDDTVGTNDYSGTEFDVTFTRVSGANAGCTESATATATIGGNGQSSVTTSVTLVNRPTGIDTRCEYDIAFPSAATGLTIQPGATATITAAAATATATYHAPTSTFTPTVAITVPDIDDTTAGTNDYTGTEFDVTFTRTSGADAGCTESATSTATIGDNGQSTATTITLVDRPTGITTRCQYDVAFPASATGLVLQAGSTTTVSATSLAATATYFAPVSNFTPTIAITVPDIQDTTAGTNDYTGTEFDVTFTRVTGANSGCTESATATATIGDNGQSAATDVTLVDRPTGITTRCQYDVMFPTATGLVLQAGSTATVSATSLAATATYFAPTSSFTPTIAITVPDIQDDTPGTNDYTSTTFDVTFTRVTGANSGCTQTATSTATIGDNGQSTATTITLVNRPTGITTRCSYDVAFPASATGLVLQAGSTTTVSATSLAATATYHAPTTNFTPTVAITVPDIDDNTAGTNDYTGTEFDVTFTRVTGANAGCTESATSTATIGDNGQSTATDVTLVDRPTGITTRCSYDVAFPTATGLVLQAGSTTTVSATSLAATATYHAPTTNFTPTVTITVPDIDDNTAGTNDYTGTEFDVTFTPVANSDAGCTQTATATATIGDNGQSTAATITLVDRPTGVTDRCQYDVTFPTSVAGLTLQTATATATATAASVTATYFAADSSFTPTVTISVPDIDDNTSLYAIFRDDNTAGTNDYTGLEFDVTFTPVANSDAGCTQTATATATIGDDGSSSVTTEATLVDRPTGVTDRCQYDVAFPTTIDLVLQASGMGITATIVVVVLALQPGSTAIVTATALAATATYWEPIATTFPPTITINVPPTQDNTPGTNDYSGTEFDVTFTRVSGSNVGCTESATATVTIGDNGESSVTTEVDLVNRPIGITNRCQYDVAFPTTTGLVLQAGSTATVDATALAATATYFAPTTNFTPTIAINVPQTQDDTPGTNDYTGTTFDVTFTRATNSNAGCTQTATSTATIGDNGQSTATDVTLVDRPTGVTDRCEYDVEFPASVGGLTLQTGSSMVSAASPAATATYFAADSSFSPTITINVPDIQDDTPGTNDYTGTEFDVTFTRTSGANAGCTESASSTVTIGDNGDSTATDVTLVDRPTGVIARCIYDVMFPAVAGLVLQAGATTTVSATATAATATYFAPTTNFTPTVAITVPQTQDDTPSTNDYSGTTFDVTFTPVTNSNAGCTQTATSTATIGDNGQSTATTITLVDRPTGITDRCQYDIAFPTTDGLVLQAGATATVSATSLAATATYFAPVSSFTPTVTITVPDIQDNTPGTNDYSGTEFDVTFTRVSGANAGCTESATSTATIGDNGQSTATTITLVDRPTGITDRCQYDVAFPTTDGLVLQAGSTATVSATSLAATATYFAPTSTFTPTVTISVPQTQDDTPSTNDYTGTEFDVTFTRATGANTGCTQTATSTATIGDNGQSTATTITLVDRPTGITDRCQYDVAFPGSAAGLVLQTGSTSTVTAAASAATATYFAADSSFTPTVTITVPDIQDDTPGTNDYTGTEFDVTFTRVSGANAGCTESATSTATIGDNGQSTATDVTLVDRPTGVDARCEYDVAFPSVDGLVLQTATATTTVSATSLAATATYFAADSSFTPTVTIIVPQTQDNTPGTNDYSGTEFDVTFTRVSGANAGCTESATSTATIGDNGQSTATEVTLVDRPTGVVTRCVYDVAFPSSAAGLVLQPGATATVTATASAASATYFAADSSFTPTVTITVPDIQDDTPGTNDYTGTTFDVTFTPVANSNAGCTQTATSTATIGDDGQSTATTISLVDRPTGITDRCSYDVAFPGSTAGLVLQPGATTTVSAAAAAAAATYFAPSSSFSPTVTIVVPQTQDNTPSVNDYAGTEFRVVFTRVSGANTGCTESAASTATIGDDGQPTATDVTLVDRPTGITDRCSYDVAFPGSAAGLVLQTGATTTVSATASAASATYFAADSSFSPTITINVPQTQDDTPGTNDYSGTEFDVTFTPVTNSNTGCTQTATATATVGDDGQSTATDVTLVDRPTGITDRCSYDVAFPGSAAGLVLQPGATTTVSATAVAAAATYFAPTSSFTPTVTISVPQTQDNTPGTNDYSGTEFEVTFTRVSGANTGCTESATSTATIGDNGQSTATEVTLVDRPTGVTDRCQYDVAFPGSAGDLTLQTSSSMVSATAVAAAATYFAADSSFSPTVTIVVPQTQDNTPGVNDYSGVEFMVVFARVSGANAGCTESATSTATIGDDGQSTATDVTLVDRPTGVTDRCQYDVAFPGSAGDLTLQTSSSMVSATAVAASATYFAADSSFSPTVTIAVPQTQDNTPGTNDYSGTEFMVVFTRVSGANTGCTESATSTVTIGDNGQPTATDVTLVDRPTGITDRCSYDVAFPASATGLVLQAGSTATVSATSLAATATYFAPVSSFSPTVSIVVPQTQDDTPGVNDYSGVEFMVVFARVSGAHAGCTESATSTVSVGDDGQSTATTITLVDRPTGIIARCSYDVAFPAVAGLVLQSGATAAVSAAAVVVSAVYVAAASSFTPTVTIVVPQTQDNTPGVNDYAGVEFTVSFAAAVGVDSGCTQSAAVTLVIGDDGSSVVSGGVVVLVGRVQGAGSDCGYAVSFPARAGTLGLRVGATAMVSPGSASASATYAVVEAPPEPPPEPPEEPEPPEGPEGPREPVPLVVVPLEPGPEVDLVVNVQLAASVNRELYSAETVAFVVEPLNDAQHPGCTTRTEFETSEPAPTVVTLVRVPQGTSAVCSYRLAAESVPPVLRLAADQEAVRELNGSNAFAFIETFRYEFRRIPVQAAIQATVPQGSHFGFTEVFEIHVNVPAACGADRTLFATVPARTGISYGIKAAPGTSYAIGPGSLTLNPAAAYTLPAYTTINGERTDCTVRATEITAPPSCVAQTTRRDDTGKPFAEAARDDTTDTISVTLKYDCAPQQLAVSGLPGSVPGQLILPAGWAALPFNGPTGTTPQAFAQALGNAVTSLWIWNTRTQTWAGWTNTGGNHGLNTLTNGDIIMTYSPVPQRVTYTPATLLNPPQPTGTLTLPTRYSHQIYTGQTPQPVADLLQGQAEFIPLILRWNVQTQQWNYNLPNRQPLTNTNTPWFDTINPGDTLLIYNTNPTPTTIPWP